MKVEEIASLLEDAGDLADYDCLLCLGAKRTGEGSVRTTRLYRGGPHAICGLLQGEADAFRTIIGRWALQSAEETPEHEAFQKAHAAVKATLEEAPDA